MTALFTNDPIQPGEDLDALAERLEAYETPPAAVFDLAHGTPEIFPPAAEAIWEPCAGTGILAGALEQLGFHVWATDVYDWGYRYWVIRDVLHFERPFAHTVVTNPPFKRAHEVVEHLLKIGVETVAVFQAWNWYVAANEAGEFMRRRPPSMILPLERRLSLWRFTVPIAERRGNSPIRYAWYVWRAGQPGDTQLRRLPKCGQRIPTAPGGEP